MGVQTNIFMPGWMTQILEVNMPKLETRLWFAPFGAFLFLKRSLLLFTMTGQDDNLKMSCDPLGLKTKFQTIMIWWCQSWGQYFWNLHARAGLPDSGGTFRCIPLFQEVLFKFPPKITGPPPKQESSELAFNNASKPALAGLSRGWDIRNITKFKSKFKICVTTCPLMWNHQINLKTPVISNMVS